MRECVQFDFVGENHLDFDDLTFVHVKSGYSRLQLPMRLNGRWVIANEAIQYRDVQWIGAIVRRQWWLLIPGLPFTCMGPVWARIYFGDWGPFVVSVILFFGFGIFPLILLARGRPFLGIATSDRIVVLPMDRQKRKIARILGLLKQCCPSTAAGGTRWQLEGTSFSNADTWDDRPATGKGFAVNRYVAITTLAGLYAFANLMSDNPRFHLIAMVIHLLVAATLLILAVIVVVRKLTD